jgi:hypothetical protein
MRVLPEKVVRAQPSPRLVVCGEIGHGVDASHHSVFSQSMHRSKKNKSTFTSSVGNVCNKKSSCSRSWEGNII